MNLSNFDTRQWSVVILFNVDDTPGSGKVYRTPTLPPVVQQFQQITPQGPSTLPEPEAEIAAPVTPVKAKAGKPPKEVGFVDRDGNGTPSPIGVPPPSQPENILFPRSRTLKKNK